MLLHHASHESVDLEVTRESPEFAIGQIGWPKRTTSQGIDGHAVDPNQIIRTRELLPRL